MADLESRLIFGLLGVAASAGLIAGAVKLLAVRKDGERERLRRRKVDEGDTLALARIALEDQDFERAAMHFITAERPLDAARAFAKAELWERAATTFENIGEFEKAAENYGKRGDHESQIRAYRKANLWGEAARVAVSNEEFGKAATLLLQGGRKAEAARMYKRAGQKKQAYTLAGELNEEAGNWELAAQSWNRVGKFKRAAECLIRAEHWDLAAKAMVRYGAHREAAELLAKHGQPDAAGRIYERLQMFAKAAECHEAAGDIKRQARCLYLAGDKMAVIQLRIAAGDLDEALRLAESIQTLERDFVEATQIAAGLREAGGDREGAIRNFRRLLAVELPLPTRRRVTRHVAELSVVTSQRTVGEGVIAAFLQTDGVQERDEAWVPELRVELGALPLDTAAPVAEAGQYEAPADGIEAELTEGEPSDFVDAVDRVIERSSVAKFRRDSGFYQADPVQRPSGWPKGVPISLSQRYADLTPVGKGGNGVVYRAHDTLLDRTVALKFMIDSAMPDELARRYFLREMKVAADLTHPNIVRIYDMGITDDALYYTMEFLEGRPLRELFVDNQPIADRARLLKVFEQLCDALSHAHAAGLVHRDIKPDNVFLLKNGDVKLFDFGLARDFDEGFGEHSIIAGTPFYMAPEQIQGRDVDGRVDVYALGVILYRAVTGHLPFGSGNVLVAHATQPPPDPRSFVAELSNTVCTVLDKALQKKPEDRYATCGELKDAIQLALGGSPW